MAFPTSVNGQITDAVTQTNTKVIGDAPAMAMGDLFQATAQALANTAHNATTQDIPPLPSLDNACTGRATSD